MKIYVSDMQLSRTLTENQVYENVALVILIWKYHPSESNKKRSNECSEVQLRPYFLKALCGSMMLYM